MIEDSGMLPLSITDDMAKSVGEAYAEYSNSKIRMQAESDLQKDILKGVSEKHDIPVSKLKRLWNLWHESAVAKKAAEDEEFYTFAQSLYEAVARQKLIGKIGE